MLHHPNPAILYVEVLIMKIKTGKNHPRFGTKLLKKSSQYFGVSKKISYYKNKIYIYWQVEITITNICKYIGNYKNEIVAARAYDKYVVEHNLPNPLNFPEEWGREK